MQEIVSDKCRITTKKEELKNKSKRSVNIKLKEDSDKEIEEELDHELSL